MKNILFVSPDLSLCASLLMYFNEKYSVTTTTNFDNVSKILQTEKFDLVVLDADLTIATEKLLKEISALPVKVPVILTYVYTVKHQGMESSIRPYVNEVFYKPFDLLEVSSKIDRMMSNCS
mgnify:FL=1